MELPDEVRGFLAREMASLFEASLPGLRPVHQDGLHLTVKFLGDIPSEVVAGATSALSAATWGFAPIRLHAADGGVYPGMNRPRVLWVGLGGEVEALQSLRAAVEESMKQAGFPEDRRATFRPHVTVARFRANIPHATVQAALDHVRSLDLECGSRFAVKGLSLMRSTLSQSGAVYDRLALVPLLNKEGRLT